MPAVGQKTEVELTDASALGVHVVVSPLLTLAMGLMDALGDRPATPWRRLLRQRTRGLDSRPLAMFSRPAVWLPNGLLPLPTAPTATFEEELAALRAQPLEVLQRDIAIDRPHDRIPPELEPFMSDAGGALERYGDALAAHWDRMLRPSWPRMRRLLEREVLLLGHKMAVDGVTGMLESLHPGVTYADRRLRFRTGHAAHATYVAEHALTLAPIACEPELILANEDHPDATVIAYAARGTAELWGEAQRAPANELAALLGATRARIALALAAPATTSALADRLALAPSSVSRHLTALLESGLVDRTRRGPVVYYRLTARGTALLDLF